METITAPTARASAPAPAARICAVLAAGCDGYPAGVTGEVLGRREGCVVFVPDSHDRVARWAVLRRHLLVPPGLLAILD